MSALATHDRRGRALRAWWLLLLAPLLACGDEADGARGRGVLLVVVDGLRRDHLSQAGYDRPTTLNLERLAQRGVSFSNTWSAASGWIVESTPRCGIMKIESTAIRVTPSGWNASIIISID